MSLGEIHECPKCHRQHRAWTQLCFVCRRNVKNYELVFEIREDREHFEEVRDRIRHEEKMLKAKGYKPTEISADKSDRILKVQQVN